MPTLTYADGFEHRTVSINDYTQTDGQGIVDAITGVPTIDTTTPRTGACCLEVAPAGAAVRVEKNMPGTNPAVCTAGFAIRFVTSLPAADARMAQFVPAAGTAARLLFHQATSKLNLAFSTGALGTDFGPVLVANTWYWVDLRLDVSGATATLDGQVDAGTNLQITLVEAASTISNMRFGTDTTNTYTARFDDWMFSYTAVDYPLGPAKVLPLYVSGDGAHNTGTAGNFTDFGSVNITDTTTNAYTHLDDWTAGVTDTTTGVIDVAGASTNYTEHTFDDTTENTIWAVMGASACYPSSTTAHVLTIRLVDSGGTTVQEILPTANFDISNVANQLEHTNRLMSTNVSQGTVNGYKVRVGLSTDVSPAPKMHGGHASDRCPGNGCWSIPNGSAPRSQNADFALGAGVCFGRPRRLAMQGRIYTVPFLSTATTTTTDLFNLDPAVDKPIRILALDVGQLTRVGDANEDMIGWTIRRFTGATITNGTGGATNTPAPVNVGDVAASFTARVMDTTIATTTGTNTLVHSSALNTRVGLLWVPPPECLALAADTAGNCRLIVRLEEAPSASTSFGGTCYVEELG